LDERPPPVFYAHRGAAIEQPENTLPSFRKALDYGAHALETDVHMTSDGHIVASHDPSGNRMAGVAALIREHTLAEVQSWDVGWGFRNPAGERPFAGADYRIPTLEQVISEFPGIPLNVDLKQPSPSMVRPVVDLIRRMKATERVVLASFRLTTLARVRLLGYEGPTALSREEALALLVAPGPVFGLLPMTGVAAQLPVRVGPITFGRRSLIEKCHRLGLRVDFWTVNDPSEARRLLELGADGIMTDDPAAIAPVFGVS
jgi:glycerophosphoryl diester phosphodiesterase